MFVCLCVLKTYINSLNTQYTLKAILNFSFADVSKNILSMIFTIDIVIYYFIIKSKRER